MKLSQAYLALLSSTVAAVYSQDTNKVSGCVESFEPDVDYFPVKYEKPDITSYGDVDIFGAKFEPHKTTDLLDIDYFNNYKIITNHFQNKTYLLYQCGTEPPQEEVASGKHHLVLPVPHKGGVALTQTVQIPPMELLGLRQEIIAYLGDPQWISSPCLNHMIDQGDVDVVWKGWGSEEQDPAEAAWLSQHPDAIILGGPFGDADGDRVVSIAASQERTNVATFDWIALYASLFNMEGLSNRIKADAQADYECSSNNAQVVASMQRKLQEEEEEPVLLWANWFDGYNWSVAECPTWDHTYYCEYAAHCDVEILSRPQGVGSNDTGFWYLTDEEFLEFGKDADVWVYGSQFWDSMYEQKKDIVDQFKSVQNRMVFDTQGMGPNAWHEQRLAEYDVVGLDVCDIMGNVNPNSPPHERRWLRNIFTEEVGSLDECQVPEELSQRYVPGGVDCVPITLEDSDTDPDADPAASVAGACWSSYLAIIVGTLFLSVVGIAV